MWVDFRHTDNKTRDEVVGTINTETCTQLGEPQLNLNYNMHHTQLRGPQPRPEKDNTYLSWKSLKEGSYISKLNANVICLVSI